MKDQLPLLFMYKFIFNLEASEDMRLPEYKGSMFRGAFGWSFRNAVCVTKKSSCSDCMLMNQCAYFKIFETEAPDNNIWFLKGVRKTPHPFIIHPPPEDKRDYKKGEVLKVGLTIFGEMVKYFPFFVYTFQQMGKQGLSVNRNKFRLTGVSSINNEGKEELVFEVATDRLTTEYQQIKADESSSEQSSDIKEFTLEFLTPARLQKEGTTLSNPCRVTLELLVALLERRYYSLSHLFCNAGYKKYPSFLVNGRGRITENKLYFHDWERYSSRQDRKIELGGFRGEIKIEGDISFLLPLFSTGVNIHIGKNTIFGLGKYRLLYSVDNQPDKN
ncbi:MAG: CRISPR system precrRNA processing endoribonuclease RAMP protein Cas6 [Ignavibacteria bacterium]